MGTNTKIRLPLGTQSQEILDVFGRCLGASMNPFAHTPQANFQAPSTPDNRWSYILSDADFSIEISNPKLLRGIYGNIHFNAFHQVKDNWFLHMEGEDENQVLLNPSSTPLAIAMGDRLVKFFGGTVQYYDGNDRINLRVPKAKSLLGQHRLKAERIDAMTNALRDVGPLLPLEIQRGFRWARYEQQEDMDAVMAACRPYERNDQLERALPAPAARREGPRF